MGSIESIHSDHIVKIQPSEDVILALNPEGDELCRLEFEVDGKKVRFRTPVLNRFPKYVEKLVKLFSYLSQYAGELEKPEDAIELFKDPSKNPIWKKLSAIAVTASPTVQKLVIDIFFNYLDGSIEGIEPKKRKFWFGTIKQKHSKAQIEWFQSHARIDDIQRVFAACLAVDDMVKKNAIFALKKETKSSQTSTVQNIAGTFAEKLGSTPKDSTATPPSSYGRL